ncbi:putative polyketide synthase [Xylariomycetidae sp. FL0641]|nr:putative polyketide synthase [Xylariomycetidae sp. FL0641]
MSPSNVAGPAKSLLVVGPKRSVFSQKELTELRTAIIESPELSFLVGIISELEDVWLPIVEAYPELRIVRGEESLRGLREYIEGGEPPILGHTDPHHSNILLDVLTVVSHVVDFWRSSVAGTRNHIFGTAATIPSGVLQDIQGFCLGFLTATAVACSHNWTDFQGHAASVLRIAVCIGALVDLDATKLDSAGDAAEFLAIRWTSSGLLERLVDILKGYKDGYVSVMTDEARATLTVLRRDAEGLIGQLSEHGFSVQKLDLQGRYHCRTAFEDGVGPLKQLFRRDPRFQLPLAAELALPLRSNVDGDVIVEGPLHEIAIDSILLHRCQWYDTLKKAVGRRGTRTDNIVRIGADSVVPRSLLKASLPSDIASGSPCGQNTLSVDTGAVAVVGMACRYPDADNLEEFWDLLISGGSAVRPLPADRFRASELTREPKDRFWGNFIRSPEHYDHRFFGMSGREAKSMDPQQRLVLQVAYEALESAGYFGTRAGQTDADCQRDVGCYMGVGAVDYESNVASHDATAFSALGTLRAFISGRISHHFGWSGPSITFDTACSSGAVAIHSAVNAIKAYECSMALAGGVNIITSPALFQNLAAASFLSPTGASKAFDARADGYSRGEGAGLLVLKSVARAQADGDTILAIIGGSAVNQGANTTPITVPSSDSQSTLYRKALSVSGIDAKDVSYVEAHGTGTPVGDPIEFESIRTVFGGPSRHNELFVGSVKDNIGHTEASSGAAALIKAVLMMQKGQIPKQANFTCLNPKIAPLEPHRLRIAQKSQPWDVSRRIAVVNNYGAAGSNAAIVVHEPGSVRAASAVQGQALDELGVEFPFFISAKTEESLLEYCAALRASLSRIRGAHGSAATRGLAYNLAVKQNRRLEHNFSFVSTSLDDVTSQLELKSSMKRSKDASHKRSVVLCFGGQTGNTVRIDGTLLQSSAIFKKHLDDCEEACQDLRLPSLYPAILDREPTEDLVSLHCQLFASQFASAMSWIDCGLKVDTLVGHSFGQLTALVVAGALSLHDGLRFIGKRAHLIQSLWTSETGSMLSIQGESQAVDQLLAQAKTRYPSLAVETACYNGHQNIVLAGGRASIGVVEELAKTTRFSSLLKVVRLNVTHAFHSSLVDPILPGLSELAATLNFQEPSIRIEACTKDQDWSQAIDAGQIVQHSRMPVYFHDAVQRTAARLGPCVFLEAGSASPVIALTRRALTTGNNGGEHVFQPIDVGGPDAINKLSRATSDLWAAGVNVQYWLFHHSQRHNFPWINLPPYQFQKNSHWIQYVPPTTTYSAAVQAAVDDQQGRSLQLLDLCEQKPEGIATFAINTEHEMFQHCTKGHAVLGQSLCPASMYVELAIRAVTRLSESDNTCATPCVKDLKISSPLTLGSTHSVFLRLSRTGHEDRSWAFTIGSRGASDRSSPLNHATGIVVLAIEGNPLDTPRMQSIQRLVGRGPSVDLTDIRSSHALQGKIVYQVFDQVVDYAAYYQGVARVVAKDHEALGIVKVPEWESSVMTEAVCDPITLDNFLQVAGIHVNCLSERDAADVFVCTELGELILSNTFMATRREMRTFRVHSTFARSTGKTTVNDIFVFDPATGNLIVSFIGAVFQSVPIKSLARKLAQLNNNQVPVRMSEAPARIVGKPGNIRPDPMSQVSGWGSQTRAPTGSVAIESSGSTVGSADMILLVRELVSRVIEVPVKDIRPGATLVDLGIDSLMSTEILSEIKDQFGLNISTEEFLGLSDIRSIAQFLKPDQHQQRRYKASIPREDTDPPAVTLEDIKGFLSELLDIPTAEIERHTLLNDLGIDSLLATEVLSGMQERFGVTILPEEFQGFQDVQAISMHVEGLSSPSSGTITPPSSSEDANGISAVVESTSQFASLAQETFAEVRGDYDEVSRGVEFANFFAAVYPAQMKLVIAYIVEAFHAMGCSLATLYPGDELPDITVLSKHQKVKRQILQILEDSAILEKNAAGQLVRTATPIPEVPAETLHQTIMADFPQHAFEHGLLASTGPRLAECLTGRADPVSILFGNAKARALMEDVYTHAPMFKAGTISLARYLVRVFEKFEEKRPIRILELGAGTGGTTKYLVECLQATKKEFEYTFTDLSPSLVKAARKKFARYDFMLFEVMNIEQEPGSSVCSQYDIVISTNCIHATKDLTRSCSNIAKCLRPEGMLCLVELTRNLPWFDLVFGLLEGWWLFGDGRRHALATEDRWRQHLSDAGFHWTDWTGGDSKESSLLRVIAASRSNASQPLKMETVTFMSADDVSLEADIHYPPERGRGTEVRPVALMIHGGGHVMLSRKDIRPTQTRILLEGGFLPVSIDYRLCPEKTLTEGPMQDVCDALDWTRTVLPRLPLQRHDIQPDGDRVVVVGWSTGGHLALTLGFTAPLRGIPPPNAILAFYCPSDYEDPFWEQPNFPFGKDISTLRQYNLLEGVHDRPITAYNVPSSKRALGGWMSPDDPRSRIALHMNWTGRCLRVLLNGLAGDSQAAIRPPNDALGVPMDPTDALPMPSHEQIRAVSPLAQIQEGVYRVPTFLIHGTKDDLVPWEQSLRTHEALQRQGVAAEIRILDGAVHLFDMYRSYDNDGRAKKAIQDGYSFLRRHI